MLSEFRPFSSAPAPAHRPANVDEPLLTYRRSMRRLRATLSAVAITSGVVLLVSCSAAVDSATPVESSDPNPSVSAESKATDCVSFNGPNPTPDEFAAMTDEWARRTDELGVKYNYPNFGMKSAADQAAMADAADLNRGLEQAPPGSVETYTEYLCSSGLADAASTEFGTPAQEDQVAALQENPEFADIDVAGYLRESVEIDNDYPALKAEQPFVLCGSAINSGSTAMLEAVLEGAESAGSTVREIALKGVEIACPTLLPPS